jgi:hypothetical protein
LVIFCSINFGPFLRMLNAFFAIKSTRSLCIQETVVCISTQEIYHSVSLILLNKKCFEDGCLLGCSTMWSGRYWLTFLGSLLHPSSGWWISHAGKGYSYIYRNLMNLWSVLEYIVFLAGKKLLITWDITRPMSSSCNSWFWNKQTVQCKGYVQWCPREWCIVAHTCCGTSCSAQPLVTGNVAETESGTRYRPEIWYAQLLPLLTPFHNIFFCCSYEGSQFSSYLFLLLRWTIAG